MSALDGVGTVGIVGAGAIGASWTALMLRYGLDVVVADPDPAAHDRLRRQVDAFLADPAGRASRPPTTSEGITTCTSAAEAAAAADLVLEAGPERLEIKRALIAEIDEAARPEVLIASSSSGLTPTSFQTAAARHPERVLVAHPFNPPHLVPLVEVVGGEQTSEEAVERAMAIFTALGRHPIRLHRELPGHVANRLQAALWQEAYHLVAEGVVSVADLDTAIASGPGLRWALAGPLLTQHLSGGGQGLRHVLQHLGPSQVEWWKTLGHPDLTPELIETLSRGVEDEIGGEEESDVLARRDAALRELIETKRQLGLG